MSTYLADEACAMTVGQLVSHLVPYLPLIPAAQQRRWLTFRSQTQNYTNVIPTRRRERMEAMGDEHHRVHRGAT